MITYSIIQKSQLEGALRLDAEYYQPEYLEIAKILQNTPHKNFNEVISNIINGAEIREYVEEDGLPYLRVSDIKEFFIDLSSVVHISKESKIKQNIKLREGDILLSRSGSLGIAAVATPDLSNSVISSHLMRIPVKSIIPYFLVAFLNSKFGKSQIIQRNNGAVVPEINHPSLRGVLVPIFPEENQKEVEDLVKNAYRQIQESNNIYKQAENLLLEELGLKDFKPEEELSFVINLSDIKSAHRADAEYFQPKYEKLISKIKNQNAKLLDKIFLIRRGDFINPNYYVQKAKRGYIRIKELPVKGDINLDAITYIDDNFAGQNLETLKEGDFVFAGIGATLGKTARIPKELEGSFYSNNTVRFRLKNQWMNELDDYYLQIVFQSIVCQWQFEQKQAQTAQAKIADEELKSVLIPILPKPTQQKIADLVKKSHEARKQAKQLLEEAKQKVEKLIEK
ncbi:MAG TPA: restriction endonuclease subunit S [Candidatus Pacearchaeota archaeon]|nr:restriction endonuclease subunit S [Candidatus Pacearchaeota archaeon]